MSKLRLFSATLLALLAFAGNSVLCRMALAQGSIDPSSFTSIRLISGAVMLCILLLCIPTLTSTSLQAHRDAHPFKEGHIRRRFTQLFSLKQSTWFGGGFLFCYAAGFSFAYISLPTGTGALILFATVQITMLSIAFIQGNRFSFWQCLGFTIALIGLVYLLLPGISAPPILGSLLMLIAGIAWGGYSVLGKKVLNPTQATAENFIRASVITLVLSLIFIKHIDITMEGFALAVASGAITSGLGYAIWYSVLPQLSSASSASLQLTVPVLATLGGLIWLGEDLNLRLVVASIAILGGVAMVVLLAQKAAKKGS